jgi:hypothetical protein
LQPDKVEQKPQETVIKKISKKLSSGEMSKVLGVTPTAIKQALKHGQEYFTVYTREKCGTAYRAINAAKPGTKIPRWKFEEIDDRNELL